MRLTASKCNRPLHVSTKGLKYKDFYVHVISNCFLISEPWPELDMRRYYCNSNERQEIEPCNGADDVTFDLCKTFKGIAKGDVVL